MGVQRKDAAVIRSHPSQDLLWRSGLYYQQNTLTIEHNSSSPSPHSLEAYSLSYGSRERAYKAKAFHYPHCPRQGRDGASWGGAERAVVFSRAGCEPLEGGTQHLLFLALHPRSQLQKCKISDVAGGLDG